MNKKFIGILISLIFLLTTISTDGSVCVTTTLFSTQQPIAQIGKRGWNELQKLLPAEGSDGEFGYDVSLSNDTVIIGAPYDDTQGLWAGAAYIFISNGTLWTQQAKLYAADAADFYHFGCAVALNGDTAFIAATNTDQDAISVYIFLRTGITWTQQQKFLVTNITEGYWMKTSLCLRDDTAIIGVPADSAYGTNSGSATIFTFNGSTWTLQQKLFSSDIIMYDNFGGSVSLSENMALIGAVGDDDSGSVSGSVYEFIRQGETWVEHQKLLASDGAADDYFGFSLAMDKDTALIGAPGTSDLGNDSGSTYVFIHSGDTWIQQQKLLAADGEQYQYFGFSVALEGNTALIGVESDNENGIDAGAAYVFLRLGTTWFQQQKLLASDGMEDDSFGCAVTLDGNTVIIGALGDGIESAGSTYVFMRENYPPEPPTIIGPRYGKINTPYTFSFWMTDPDGDPLYGFWDWGDGTSGWLGPFQPGQYWNTTHSWSEPGNYTIRIKLKDIWGAESDWSTFTIQIVRLRIACFFGRVEPINQTDDLLIMHGLSLIILPSTTIINKDVTLVISKNYFGYLGSSYLLGISGISIL